MTIQLSAQYGKHLSCGSTVIVSADHGAVGTASVLAITRLGANAVLVRPDSRNTHDFLRRVAGATHSLDARSGHLEELPTASQPRLLRDLGDTPALILASSGSGGRPKAIAHDMQGLIDRRVGSAGEPHVAIAFLQFDHMGGLNTLIYSLSNGGTLVTLDSRQVNSVRDRISQHGVDLLPTTPTFLAQIARAPAFCEETVPSLRLITYGTEPVAEDVLRLVHQKLPDVRMRQTYGMSEFGVLSSRSFADDSGLISLGGSGYETRVVDDELHVRAAAMMLGYLDEKEHAEAPSEDDGWFRTGDFVTREGAWLRIHGRRGDAVLMAGERVWPVDVEAAVRDVVGVREVVAYASPHLLVGEQVIVKVRVAHDADRRLTRGMIRERLSRLLPGAGAARVLFASEGELLVTERFKADRRSE